MGKKSENPKNTKFEDITSNSAPDSFGGKIKYFGKYKLKPFFCRNHHHNLKVLIGTVACVLVLVIAAAAIFGISKLNKLKGDDFKGDADATIVAGDEDISPDNHQYALMDDATGDSLKSICYSWATNGGEKMRSKNVVNVLLIGEDNDDGSHRSDSMILVSLNKETKKITLVSFLRDAYTYMNIKGAKNPERYDKTNHAYAWGGPSTVIETLENNYKIEIDHYFTINFKCFKDAIDSVGGVNVPITEAEAKYMNRTTHFNDFSSGKSVHLDGAHALIFSRIRKLDSEAARTDRQKLVISALIKKAKTANMAQLNNLLDKLLPLMSTNYSKTEIVSLGTQAIKNKWMDYSITTMTEPEERFRAEATMNTYSYNGLFVWIVDYPLAAQSLQTTLYGKSNIVISADHESPLKVVSNYYGESYTSGNSNSGYNYNYDRDYDYDYDNDYDYTTNYEDDTDDDTEYTEPDSTEDNTEKTHWWDRHGREDETDAPENPDSGDVTQQDVTQGSEGGNEGGNDSGGEGGDTPVESPAEEPAA